MSRHNKSLAAFFGDILVLYGSLLAVLLLRYPSEFYEELLRHHLGPFTALFPAWLIVFYIAGLYDFHRLRNNLAFFQALAGALAANAVLSMLFFYLVPALRIAPKTNLAFFIIVFAVLVIFWRRWLNTHASAGPATRVILWGGSPATRELAEHLQQNPHLGYTVRTRVEEGSLPLALKGWEEMIRDNEADLIVVPRQMLKESTLARVFFELFDRVQVRDFPDFYEEVFKRVPAAELDEAWFLETLARRRDTYDGIKRIGEFLAAAIVFCALLPLLILLGLAVILTSPGPAIYAQIRVGRNGQTFTLYKFRTMREDAEKHGPQWAPPAGDRRTTTVGRFLRHSHLDELPQLVNILKGNLSFVGPRPERPEFVKILREQVPYYEMRSLVKPGVTGWAQIHYRKDTTVEDVRRKIQYDLYYLKHRSLALDLAILLKTVKTFFSTPS